ncbi:MAG: amidohydrolase family protein [Solirubrobacterales bacterium]|nr:amidohydrolase family protein [Solirubrobacterales bacterium]
MDALDRIAAPWYAALATMIGEVLPFDAHTHVGVNDPDGYRQTPAELLAALEPIDASAVVFPMHEPAGYSEPNDFALATAAASERLAAYCRVDPFANAVGEARRCLNSGASGIKLHPRAEGFGLDHPAVSGLFALAHERSLPVLIHAGRGIPALGEHAVSLAGEFPQARVILAHAAVSDLAWIWRAAAAHRNIFLDTAWWNPADLSALFGLVPASRILWASDSPYGRPSLSFAMHMRYALEAGVPAEAIGLIGRRNMELILAGDGPAEGPPPPGLAANGEPIAARHDPLLARISSHLSSSITAIASGGDPTEALSLARLACAVGDAPHADVCAAVLELLDHADALLDSRSDDRSWPLGAQPILFAICAARTPSVPLPELPDAPPPTRAEAERRESG